MKPIGVKTMLRPACIHYAEMLRRWKSSPHLSGLLGNDDCFVFQIERQCWERLV
jgi:hypothetical protein